VDIQHNPRDNRVAGFESAFLEQLDQQALDTLLSLGTTSNYCKGAFIFSSGESGQHVFFLRKGRIKIHNLSPAGHEVILWFCCTGEMFGLSEITRGNDRVVSAQACEDSEVLSIHRDQFNTFLMHHPKAAFFIFQILSCRMRVLSDMLVNLVSDTVNTRLAKLILRLSAQYGTREGKVIHLDINFTHQEIADMIGTSRQTATTLLGQFKRQGILSIDNRRILIESEELLHGLVKAS
jgi:CRP-like cAMP-binding protein